MKKVKTLLSALFLLSSIFTYAQGVGINNDGSAPDPSAILDVKSATQGMLVPRMTSAQRLAISTPANSLLIYDTNTQSFWFYSNSAWQELKSSTSAPASEISDIDGNTKVTVDEGNDNIIRFYSGDAINETIIISNNRIEPKGFNTIIGDSAATQTSENGTVAIGYHALISSLGGANTAIGMLAMENDANGSFNTAIGYYALTGNTNGSANTAVGVNSNGYYWSNGSENTSIGGYSLGLNYLGNKNTAVGNISLYCNSTGSKNTALGHSSMYSNRGGYENTSLGYLSMYSNTSGARNCVFGTQALHDNKSAHYNVAIGYNSAYSDTSGSYNVSIGSWSLENNINGHSNVAIGVRAASQGGGQHNIVAIGDSALFNNNQSGNVAVGSKVLYSNTTGGANTAIGHQALQNSTGNDNTAVGRWALHNLTSGNGNTVIGDNGWPYGTTTYSNYTGLGYYVGSGVADPSNRVEIGNTSVLWIGGQVGWSTYSDQRIKKNIRQDVPGLDFVMKLKPVTYNLDIHQQNRMANSEKETKDWPGKYDIEQKRMTGFLAQEVAEAAQQSDYEFSGVDIPENEDELYSLRYAEFVVPLVKAVQELAEENQEQQVVIEKLLERIEKLENK
ncbi:MAG: tail fiber domain-containing protein [Bacteroidales bacterium]|nr:tail fiber domain-containing protein [Bacteroidales bacterium]